MKKIFLSLFFIFTIPLLSLESIKVSATNEILNILPQTEVFIDTGKHYSFEDVFNNTSKLFTKNKKKFLHFGYTSDTIWLHFSIKNETKASLEKVLQINNQVMENITLYGEEKNHYIKHEPYNVQTKNQESFTLNPYFKIQLKPKESKEYYLKISSYSSAVYFKLLLMDTEQLYEKEMHHQLILALFFGSLLSLIIYNLFIFIFTKDFAYLYYTLYLTFVMVEHLSYTFFCKHIYPPEFLQTDNYLNIFYLSLMTFFALLFTREFLQIKQYKKIDLSFKILLGICAAFLLLISPSFYPLDIVVFTILFVLFYLLIVIGYLFFQGKKNTKFIFFGWFISIFGWLMLGTYNIGGWSVIYHFTYFFELTVIREALLFSLALANKLNTTKKLEQSLRANKILTQELHHRVKNNMQLIVSMYRLKLSKYSNDKLLNTLQEIERSIQAISSLHEMLYTQQNWSATSTKLYFERLVEQFQNSYAHTEIKIELTVTTNLKTEYLIDIGIIINELVTNAYKYAFSEHKGLIVIKLLKENNFYTLLIKDNGGGIDLKTAQEGFGIELVKALVDERLQGSLDIDVDKGTLFKILWKG